MFFDRYDAGEQLALKLANEMCENTWNNTVVYALPKGGVIIGFEVAKALRVPLDIVVSRKVRHPINRECLVCAVTEDGERVCDEIGICGVDHDWVEIKSKEQQKEARLRRLIYTGNQGKISAKGKDVILVDDGIENSLMLKAALQGIHKQKPHKIIIASPVSSHNEVIELSHLVDEVIVLIDEKDYRGTTASYYTHFSEVFDKEVQAALNHIQIMYNDRVSIIKLIN